MEPLYDDIPKKSYVRATERVLYEYPFLLVGQENEEELEKKGLGNLFPSMVASYDDMPRGGGISKPTENWAMKRAEKSIKIMQIQRALGMLSPDERMMIEAKYFDTTQPSDLIVYEELRWNHKTYYKIKDRAIRKMAIALNII